MSEDDIILTALFAVIKTRTFPHGKFTSCYQLVSAVFTLYPAHSCYIQIGQGVLGAWLWPFWRTVLLAHFPRQRLHGILIPSLPVLYQSGSGSGIWTSNFSDLNSRTFWWEKPHKWVANIYFLPSSLYPRLWVFKKNIFINCRTPLIKELPQGRVNRFFETVTTIKSSLTNKFNFLKRVHSGQILYRRAGFTRLSLDQQ